MSVELPTSSETLDSESLLRLMVDYVSLKIPFADTASTENIFRHYEDQLLILSVIKQDEFNKALAKNGVCTDHLKQHVDKKEISERLYQSRFLCIYDHIMHQSDKTIHPMNMNDGTPDMRDKHVPELLNRISGQDWKSNFLCQEIIQDRVNGILHDDLVNYFPRFPDLSSNKSVRNAAMNGTIRDIRYLIQGNQSIHNSYIQYFAKCAFLEQARKFNPELDIANDEARYDYGNLRFRSGVHAALNKLHDTGIDPDPQPTGLSEETLVDLAVHFVTLKTQPQDEYDLLTKFEQYNLWYRDSEHMHMILSELDKRKKFQPLNDISRYYDPNHFQYDAKGYSTDQTIALFESLRHDFATETVLKAAIIPVDKEQHTRAAKLIRDAIDPEKGTDAVRSDFNYHLAVNRIRSLLPKDIQYVFPRPFGSTAMEPHTITEDNNMQFILNYVQKTPSVYGAYLQQLALRHVFPDAKPEKTIWDNAVTSDMTYLGYTRPQEWKDIINTIQDLGEVPFSELFEQPMTRMIKNKNDTTGMDNMGVRNIGPSFSIN